MTDKEWHQFESTGKITDYLSYINMRNEDSYKEIMSWSVSENGTDHTADRNDTLSISHRGI